MSIGLGVAQGTPLATRLHGGSSATSSGRREIAPGPAADLAQSRGDAECIRELAFSASLREAKPPRIERVAVFGRCALGKGDRCTPAWDKLLSRRCPHLAVTMSLGRCFSLSLGIRSGSRTVVCLTVDIKRHAHRSCPEPLYPLVGGCTTPEANGSLEGRSRG